MNLASGRIDPKFLIALVLLVPFLFFLCRVAIDEGAFFAIAIISSLLVGFITLVRTDWALVVLIFATLLSPEVAIGVVEKREVAIRIEDILLMVISFTWLAKLAINKEFGFIRETPLNGAIKIYVWICLIATLVGVLRGFVSPYKGTFFLLKYLEYFILYFLVINNIHKQEQIKLLLGSFFAVCLVISLYGLSQIGSVDRLSAPFEGEGGEPNTFGGYLLFLFSLSLGLFLYSKEFQKKICFGGLAVLTCVVLLLTLSRGSYLGLVFACLVFFLLTQYGRSYLLFGMLSLSVAILLFPGSIQNRILYTFSVWNPEVASHTVKVFNVALDPSSSARISSWGAAMKDWMGSPFIGRGIGGSGLIDSQFFTSLVETGVLGTVVFTFLLWQILKMAYRAFRQEEDRLYQGLFLGYFAGFIGLLFHSLTANTFILIRVMEPFWFMTGVIVALPQVRLQESGLIPVKPSPGA